MGRPKLLLPWPPEAEAAPGGGAFSGTVLGSLLAALAAGGAEEIALVLGPADGTPRGHAAERLRARATTAALPGCRLTVAENPAPEDGMLSTVLRGLAALGGPGSLTASHTALLVTPADLPALQPATVKAVLAALHDGAPLAVPVHATRRGHPLAIAPSLLPLLPTLDPTRGPRHLLDLHPPHEISVEDPGSVHDLDTPADYASLVEMSDS